METTAGKKPDVALQSLATIMKFTVRSIRSGIENSTHGVLSVLNLGCKKKVPKVTNDILLQPAAMLAAKIRQGKVSVSASTFVYYEKWFFFFFKYVQFFNLISCSVNSTKKFWIY